jgi:hypothetical protein
MKEDEIHVVVTDIETPLETANVQEESLCAPAPQSDDLTPSPNDDAKANITAKPLASIKDVFSFGSGLKTRICLVLGILCSILAGLIMPAVAFVFASSFQRLGASTSSEGFLDQVR